MTNLIFGGINFVVILMVGKYVYLRWFRSQIVDAIASKDQYHQDLNSELSGLENKIKEVSLDLVLQQEQASDLLQKVQNWQAVYQADLQLQAAQVKSLQIAIDTKNQLKLQNLVVNLAQKKLLKQSLPQVEQGLIGRFADQLVAADFLKQACNKLDQD